MPDELNHGLILEDILVGEHYVLGGTETLGGTLLRPDRDWRPFIPKHQETQNRGFETYACTNFGTANALEILRKALYGEEADFSDRWYAKASGTTITNRGNSPHTVAEFARKNGLIEEQKWPFDDSVKDAATFYADFPEPLFADAKGLLTTYVVGHEWVPLTAEHIYNALQYSPLGFSVYAWRKDGDLYYKPAGVNDNHWTCCVYAEWEKYWLVLDSYLDEGVLLKKVRWDAIPQMVKRYSLTQKPHVFSKNLGFQMMDPEVKFLQRALISLGYVIPNAETVFYGTQTKAAVAKFQAANGIVDDGSNFGPRTRLALNRVLNPDTLFGGSVLTYLQALFSGV